MSAASQATDEPIGEKLPDAGDATGSLSWWWRTRSLNAPSPVQQFGPCGRIMTNSAMVMQIQDPASQRLTWYKPPLTVLVIKKVSDASVLAPFVQLVEWLLQEKNMVVWVESAVLEDSLLNEDVKFKAIRDKLVTFKDGRDDLTDRIDFIVCLGGDGTLLYASLLFQQSVPPVMAFHLGSLGFLTPFRFDNFQEQLTSVLEGHAALTLRSRLRCVMHRKSEKRQLIHTEAPPNSILVLNEVVIDRGPSPYLSNIDLFLDGKYITSVQGDGLIVSTPTGSTAYAVAAGASMIHPSVPAIMVTPICPHSLSFRPIVVPAGVELKISVSPESRNTSWVSFDGRNRQELFHGDSLRVTTSIYPVPSISAQDQISDWFASLADGLHWNVRKRQKCLDELSDLTASGSEDTIDEIENMKLRTRSLNAPSPFQQFGPCGRIMKNSAMVMQIQDPASQRLTWYKPPLTVLVIKKKDSQVLLPFVQLVEWLVQEKHMVVWVESAVLEDKLLRNDVKLDQESAKFRQVHGDYAGVRERFLALREKLVTFKDGRDDLTDRIDFIVCLGGDGTLLYASQLFQQSVPPVMAFYLGSLGFLTPFQCDNFQEQVTNVLEGHAALTLRSRLRCSIHRKGERRRESLQQASNNLLKPSLQRQLNYVELNNGPSQFNSSSNNKFNNNSTQLTSNNSILVLNEVVINRGPSPYLSNIDIFLDGKYITSVQGDGLIVSTPTGSTAYAAAAGASMIHPSVPAILVTPICPHSLSFRPIVVPAGVELKISISPDSRNTSRVSFDGRNDQELNHGDSLRVTTSIYPVPSICSQDQISDWFDSLAEGLHWNVRKRQKCLDELSDLTASGSEDALDEFDNLKLYDV
ncbi:uncharacterized protein LOC6640738 isoform X3 [Drosophila willistoni]|uniref:uncharacterized protein LOC6640738 isoform X3 n=1 Tax=Drosophila willistoni TaxID=7260 RepID=UPI000C26D780|nr:uncharacterized protein LOC6640738 isoform X3 [Drosophila willistoni]